MLPYADLTPTQQTQAATELFFADAFMGFNPANFAYEVDREGRVTGRVELHPAREGKRQQLRNQPHLFRSSTLAEVDPDLRYRLESGINELARQVAVALVKEMEPAHAI